MEFGIHLPLIGFLGAKYTRSKLVEYTERARDLGYIAIAANDHLVFPRPWLDGPTALASVLHVTGDMQLATTVSIPVVRNPVAMAKTLSSIDHLSEGKLIIGVGPGSSAKDYESVGIPFDERWKRLDDAVLTMRSLMTADGTDHTGDYYSTVGISMEPLPAQRPAPPIWIGSWGSDVGLKRTARIGDGWLASAYNTTPEDFSEGLRKLNTHLSTYGKDPKTFPNGIATMLFHITEDTNEAERILDEIIRAAINRPLDELRARLCVGPASEVREKLAALEAAGAQRVYMWPVVNEMEQIDLFAEQVMATI